MLSEEQIRKIISANESLQIQLADANRMLAAREEEIEFLSAELSESTALRSKLDGQLAEIENIEYELVKKKQAAKGAEERELELHQELTGMALLNKQYNELMQDYAYLQSRFKDAEMQLGDLIEKNLKLEKVAGIVGELQSLLENTKIERDDLKIKINTLEGQKFLKDI